ncbi:GNAT family N-acetyltransferase [Candidatus Entotheonella palauensis]|nr:GNAT family N-acetyltransferase [Candidatus Entotheonella palauensis]
MPTIEIHAERPDTPDAMALISELETHLAAGYPSESRHGYSVEKLIRQRVDFFIVRSDGMAAACGGLQAYDTYGELKRMYVRPVFRGLGFGKLMVNHLVEHAQRQGLPLVRLETGIHQKEAIGLYERMGFQQIGPFGEYKPDPLSLFYEKPIAAGDMP